MKTKGYIYKNGTTWHYIVRDKTGKIVFSDNTGCWDALVKPCLRDVFAARRVQGAGHKFQYSYPEIIEQLIEGKK